MKNIKTIVVTSVVVLVLSIGFQTYAARFLPLGPANTDPSEILAPKVSVPVTPKQTEVKKSTINTQTSVKENIRTENVVVTDPVEIRLRLIEARLNALEAKHR